MTEEKKYIERIRNHFRDFINPYEEWRKLSKLKGYSDTKVLCYYIAYSIAAIIMEYDSRKSVDEFPSCYYFWESRKAVCLFMPKGKTCLYCSTARHIGVNGVTKGDSSVVKSLKSAVEVYNKFRLTDIEESR